MSIQRMDHVGIVVEDLAAAIDFFVQLGLELQWEGQVEGDWVDRVVGLEGVRAEIAMLQTKDGHGRIELSKFHSPSGQDVHSPSAQGEAPHAPPAPGEALHSPAHQGEAQPAPANAPGIRHISFEVEDIDAAVAGLLARGAELVGEVERYKDVYRLCYVRGPEGIIVELAERIG